MIGLVHRIYRTCSSWQLFDRAIEEAKIILHNNQYSLSFIEDIINSTLNRILSVDEIQINDVNETYEDLDENNSDTVSIYSNAYTGVFSIDCEIFSIIFLFCLCLRIPLISDFLLRLCPSLLPPPSRYTPALPRRSRQDGLHPHGSVPDQTPRGHQRRSALQGSGRRPDDHRQARLQRRARDLQGQPGKHGRVVTSACS